ncbi:replication initiator protein [Microviridae sp.]|nr:replication initiator protein [Microviridae sp.]
MRCPKPITLKDPNRIKSSRALQVPCGYCGACRANKRAMWSFRIKEEAKVSSSCYFITLTYAPEYLPIITLLDPETGHIIKEYPTLWKKDLQNFWKAIRKYGKLRYYAVGEYGSNTKRPHYHAMIFNANQKHLDKLQQVWGKGNVHVHPQSDATIHYTTKYHVNFDKSIRYPAKKEFASMSLKPAIGSHYISKNAKFHTDNEYLYVINNGFKQPIPRYYKEKLFTPEKLDQLRDQTYIQVDKDFDKEYNRLIQLHVDDPINYIKQSLQIESDKVKDKARSQDKL